MNTQVEQPRQLMPKDLLESLEKVDRTDEMVNKYSGESTGSFQAELARLQQITQRLPPTWGNVNQFIGGNVSSSMIDQQRFGGIF